MLNKRIFYMIIFNNDTYSKERVDYYNELDKKIFIQEQTDGSMFHKYNFNPNLSPKLYPYIIDFVKLGNNKLITKLIPPNPVINNICFKKNKYVTCSKSNKNDLFIKSSIVDTNNNNRDTNKNTNHIKNKTNYIVLRIMHRI